MLCHASENNELFPETAHLAGAAAADVLKDVPELLVLYILPLHACTDLTHP